MKKGDMSMGVIIGAAIALLILVIISVLLFDSFNQLADGTSCEGTAGAYCTDSEFGCGDGEVAKTTGCSGPDDICCVPTR